MREKFLNGRLVVATGDITGQVTAAIINAANSTLLGGGGPLEQVRLVFFSETDAKMFLEHQEI